MDNKEEIGYAWNLAADLGNGRQLSLTGNFAKGISLENMNKEVDMIRSVFDRQQAKSAARGAEEQVRQLILRFEDLCEDLVRIDENHSKKGGTSAAERQQREATVINIEKMAKDVEYKKSVLAKLLDEAK